VDSSIDRGVRGEGKLTKKLLEALGGRARVLLPVKEGEPSVVASKKRRHLAIFFGSELVLRIERKEGV